MEYSIYKKVCPEQIIDFFEKHLEFTAAGGDTDDKDSINN